jgi:phosphomannomutase
MMTPWPFDGAVSVTASHLPSQWNGFKFFTPDAPSNIGEEGISGIINALASDDLNDVVPKPVSLEDRRCPQFLPVYSEFLQSTVCDIISSSSRERGAAASGGVSDDDVKLPLKGLKICVNAGNGAGGFLAESLSVLGADTSSSLFLEPDGSVSVYVPFYYAFLIVLVATFRC